VSEGKLTKESVGRKVTCLNSTKGPNFMCLMTTTINQYKNYIQKRNACKENETIGTKLEKK